MIWKKLGLCKWPCNKYEVLGGLPTDGGETDFHIEG